MNYQPPPRQQLFELRRILLRWLTGSLAIFVAVWVVPGIEFTGPGWQLGIVALILGLLSTLLRPILLIFTLPLILLTLGFFVLIINALMLALTSSLADQLGIAFHVDGFGAAFLGGLVISVVSGLLNLLAGDHNIQIHIRRGEEQD